MKTVRFTLLTLFLSIVFTNCKKGEDDPAISLRSRKARVEGNWKMEKGFTSQIIFGSLVETTYTANSFRQVNTLNGSEKIIEGSASYTANFNKNGAVVLQKIWRLITHIL